METLLLVVTLVSVALAVSMGAIAWRLARDARVRSAARVSALRAAAGGDAWLDPSRSDAVLPIQLQAATMPAVERLFAAADEPTGVSRQRGLAWAAAVLLVVLAAAGVSMSSNAPGTATHDAETAPLELLSLRHERAGALVNVSGLVRNPKDGAPVERLTAVVFLFDGEGGFLTSARASVNFLRLGPGDDTPFVIAMPAPPSAARYRVSFRTDAGIVPHVDLRAPAAADARAVTR